MAILPSDIPKRSAAEQDMIFRTIFANSRMDAIRSRIETIGYSLERMAEGEELLRKLNELELLHGNISSSKLTARSHRDSAIKQAHEVSGITRKILKVTLNSESGIHQQLGIDQPREKQTRVHKWIAQHELFYGNMNNRVISILNEFGYSDEKITGEREMIRKIAELHKEKAALSAKAKKVVVQKTALRKDLQEWISRYLQLAQIACMDKPQILESLGILVRSQ